MQSDFVLILSMFLHKHTCHSPCEQSIESAIAVENLFDILQLQLQELLQTATADHRGGCVVFFWRSRLAAQVTVKTALEVLWERKGRGRLRKTTAATARVGLEDV